MLAPAFRTDRARVQRIKNLNPCGRAPSEIVSRGYAVKDIASSCLGLGVLALVGVAAASSARAPLRPTNQRGDVAPGVAHLMAFGSRSPAQQRSATASKLDGALADLARHAS